MLISFYITYGKERGLGCINDNMKVVMICGISGGPRREEEGYFTLDSRRGVSSQVVIYQQLKVAGHNGVIYSAKNSQSKYNTMYVLSSSLIKMVGTL